MIFVDSGAWFALYVRQEPDHAAMRDWFRRNHHQPLLTTDYVVDETLTLMRSRGARPQSIAFADFIFVRRAAKLHFVSSDEILAALDVFRRFADKAWSFTDCTSHVIMERLGIDTAASLDHHFRQFGTVTVVP